MVRNRRVILFSTQKPYFSCFGQSKLTSAWRIVAVLLAEPPLYEYTNCGYIAVYPYGKGKVPHGIWREVCLGEWNLLTGQLLYIGQALLLPTTKI